MMRIRIIVAATTVLVPGLAAAEVPLPAMGQAPLSGLYGRPQLVAERTSDQQYRNGGARQYQQPLRYGKRRVDRLRIANGIALRA
jgi:hypothetical protein